jgi:molybdate transport system substrate-binding protein
MPTTPSTPRAPLAVLTSNATRAVLDALAETYERQSGARFTVNSDSASVMLARIRSGETADLAVLNAPDLAMLVAERIICESRPFARSRIGVAVRTGNPHPNIGSVDDLKRTLLDAGLIAHTVHGASGKLVPALLERLGIAHAVTTVTRPGGLIGKVVAAGEAAIAIQQISELLAVRGIEVVGPLPDELQTVLESAAGIFVCSKAREASETLLRFLTTPEVAAVLAQKGLEQHDGQCLNGNDARHTAPRT